MEKSTINLNLGLAINHIKSLDQKSRQMENKLVTPREVVKTVYDSFTTSQIKEVILRVKPTEIYNLEYSRKDPVYFITEIKDDGIYMFSKSWYNKEPIYYSWEQLRSTLSMSGMENVRF